MVGTHFLSAITFALACSFLLGGYGDKSEEKKISRNGNLKEFSFTGGKLQDGKITVDAAFRVEKDQKSKTVFLRRQDTSVGIDCACFIEGEGSCFPVVDDQGEGPVIVSCAAANCSGEEIDFCVMEIGTAFFKVKFTVPRAAVKMVQ